jgi:glucan phosphoethanolaminetransferase (alkaline phosphatase superfamily)
MQYNVLECLNTRIKYYKIAKKYFLVITSSIMVVTLILVVGVVVFPYNYAITGKNHDASGIE